jgi:kinesin family protein C1
MQLSGNIRVYVRVRPTIPGEENEGAIVPEGHRKRKHRELDASTPFSYPGFGGNDAAKSSLGADDPTKNLLEVREPWTDRGGLRERRKTWTFGFDSVFTPSHGQSDIWEATEPLVQSAIDGYNVTVFAYGQTGSGKTYTMLGESGNEGIVSRSIKMLFSAKESIAELTRGKSKVEISVELLEIYNEKVRDLLISGKPEDQNLKVKANQAVGSTVLPVDSENEVFEILQTAQSRRCVKATASNAVSSRSHMLFTLHFKVVTKSGKTRVGRLNVCDLAGSERLGKSNANETVGVSLLETCLCS